nr:hypothetical protein [Frondihabitans sp. PAMC 28766]
MQLALLRGGEGGEAACGCPVGGVISFVEKSFALGCERELVAATVHVRPTASNDIAFFKPVQDADKIASVDTEVGGDVLLGGGACQGDGVQNAVISQRQPKVFEAEGYVGQDAIV